MAYNKAMERLRERFREFQPAGQFKRLKEYAVSSGIPEENFQPINILPDVLYVAPFVDDEGVAITTFTDLDALMGTLRPDDSRDCLRNRLALRDIVCKSEKFILWSNRISIDDQKLELPIVGGVLTDFFERHFPQLPFVSNRALRELLSILERDNPNCDIDLKATHEKLIFNPDNRSGFINHAIQELLAGRHLVVIGSGFIDRRLVRGTIEYAQRINRSRAPVERILGPEAKSHLLDKAADQDINLTKLYYYDTGHLIF